MAEGLRKWQMVLFIEQLENYVTLLTKHSIMLGELITHVEENISRTQGSKHLWATVDAANDLIAGPTRAYVDQG
jgi:hypothetical protein